VVVVQCINPPSGLMECAHSIVKNNTSNISNFNWGPIPSHHPMQMLMNIYARVVVICSEEVL
jgi:hypothetical protein